MQARCTESTRAITISDVHVDVTLEAQLPIYWVPVLKSLYEFILSITQGPTIWVPGASRVIRSSTLGTIPSTL